jgi:hypothetical protein
MAKIDKDFIKAGVTEVTGIDTSGKSLQQVIKEFEKSTTIITPERPYVPAQSRLWGALIWRIGLDILRSTKFTSNFARFISKLETGGDVHETFINLKDSIDRNSLSNSDLFTMFVDDIQASFHRINNEEVFVTDYREAEIRKVVQNWDTLTNKVGAIVANLRNSFENWFEDRIYQMLFDYYKMGALSASSVADPILSKENSSLFIARLNELTKDFTGKPSVRHTMANNVLGGNPNPAITRSEVRPVIVTFQDTMANAEMINALELHFGRSFKSGNDNQDFMQDLIIINRHDFDFINGDENNPREVLETRLATVFGGNPMAIGKIQAFVMSQEAFQLYVQFELMLDFMNIITLNVKQTFHIDMINSLSPFTKAHVLVSEEEIENGNG